MPEILLFHISLPSNTSGWLFADSETHQYIKATAGMKMKDCEIPLATRSAKKAFLKLAEVIALTVMPKRLARFPGVQPAKKYRSEASSDVEPQNPATRTQQRPLRANLDQQPSSTLVAREPNHEQGLWVSMEFLQQIQLTLRSNKDIMEARVLHQQALGRIGTIERRLQYVERTTTDMICWLGEQNFPCSQADDDDRPSLAVIQEELETYDKQMVDIKLAFDTISRQRTALQEKLDQTIMRIDAQRVATSERLLSITTSNGKLSLLTSGDFDMTDPIDAEQLRLAEEDCNNFEAFLYERSSAKPSKYPTRLAKDAQFHCLKVEVRRQRHDKAKARLAELETITDEDDENSLAGLRKQKYVVAAMQRDLMDAIEGVRFAGVSCKSDGSIIYPTIGFDLGDDDPSLVHDESPKQEMVVQSRAVAEAHLDRSRIMTETWLSQTSLDLDPEQVGPATPLEPCEIEFEHKLKDVEAKDSISVVGN